MWRNLTDGSYESKTSVGKYSIEKLKKSLELTFYLLWWVHSAEVVKKKEKLPVASFRAVAYFIWINRLRTSRKFIFTIAAWPRSSWHFSNLASSKKSDFALKWGTFSSSMLHAVWGDSLWCSFHKLIIAVYDCFRYNTRKQSHFFLFREPLCPLAASLRKTRVKMFGNASVSRRGTRPRHSVPSSFPKP